MFDEFLRPLLTNFPWLFPPEEGFDEVRTPPLAIYYYPVCAPGPAFGFNAALLFLLF
jgi:hypothetical protein